MTIRNTSVVKWHRTNATRPSDRPVLVAGREEATGACDTAVAMRSGCGWVILAGELKPNEITHWAHLPDPPRELTEAKDEPKGS